MSDLDRRGGGTSYLVRLWREPDGDRAGLEPARVYIRDLRSGEERYLKNLDGLADYLDRQHGPRQDAVGVDPAVAAGSRSG